MNKLNGLPILLVFCLMVLLMSKQAFAGGQPEPEAPPPLADKVVCMAWYEGRFIHIALANTSDIAYDLTVSIGTRDVGTNIYGSQKFTIPENSIHILKFHPLTQKNVRGDLERADTVFIYSHDHLAFGHVSEISIQNIGQDNPSAYLKDYVVDSKLKTKFNYKMELDKNLDIILIPKSIKLNGFQMRGSVTGGAGERIEYKDIENLGIPYSYKKEIVDLMVDNFCFAVGPDSKTTISIDYQVPNIDNCKTVTIPVHTYTFTPSGGLLSGGETSTFMIYNSRWAMPKAIEGDLKMPGCCQAPLD